MGAQLNDNHSLVVGVTRLAWMYGRSRDWAKRLLEEWYEEQRLGTGPVRVFKQGDRDSLYTTIAILHQVMPPGKDVALYKRVKAVEEDVDGAHQRIDREVIERKQADGEIEKRVKVLESRRPK